MKNKKAVIGISIIILIILAVFLFKEKKESSYDSTIVQRGEIVEQVSATGTVKPVQEVNLRFETNGTIEEIYVSEGDKVKQGAKLVKLYTSKLYSQLLQVQASYNQAKAELEQYQAGATPEAIQVAEQEVETAQTNLTDIKAQAENDIDKAYDDALDTFNNAYFNADKAMKKLKTLFDENTLYKEYRDDLTFRSIQAKTDTKDKKEKADLAFKNLKNLIAEIRADSSDQKIDNSFEPFLSYLRTIRDALDSAGELVDLIIIHSDYSQSQWDTDQDNIETGRIAINTAITNTLIAKQAVADQKVANQKNINAAKNTLEEAQENLAELKAPPRAVDIAVYQAKVDKAKASMVELQQKLNDATLTAPFSGTVAKINIKIGEVVTAGGDAVISLISSSKFEIKVDVPEADIGKVKVGNPVNISLDAFPEESWPGQVVEIEPAETMIEGIVYYKVKVVFDEIDQRVKTGMSTDISIETQRKENVLHIPYRSIIYKQEKKMVRVVQGEEIKQLEVKTGIKNEKGEIEILSGLQEGQEVITFMRE